MILTFPTDPNDSLSYGIENIKFLLENGVQSYIEILQNSGVLKELSPTVIDNTKAKVHQLSLYIQGLKQSIHAPQLLLDLPQNVNDWIEANRGRDIDTIIEEMDQQEENTSLINSMQSVVNRWVKHVQYIIGLTHDILNGIAEEIVFLTAKETALKSLNSQINSREVNLILSFLRANKKSHAAILLLSNSTIDESLKTTISNNDFLKGLNIEALKSVQSIADLKDVTNQTFGGFKRLKFSKYSTDKFVIILKLITTQFDIKLVEIITKNNLFLTRINDFDELIQNTEELLDVYDTDLRICITLVREIFRKQGDVFQPIKIDSHLYIIEVLKEIRKVIIFHDEFDKLITTLMSDIDSSIEDQIRTYEKMLNESQNAYNTLVQCPQKELFDKNFETLNKQKSDFYQKISFIERKIVDIIKSILLKVKDDYYLLFELYQKFEYILNKPQIRLVTQEFQSILLHATEQEINELEYQFKSQVEIKKLIRSRNLPTFTSSILWTKQVVGAMSSIFSHLTLILTKDWTNYPEGRKFATRINLLMTEIDVNVLLKEWLDKVTGRVENLFMQDEVIIIVEHDGISNYQVNYSEFDFELCSEVECLRFLKFSIPSNVVRYSQKLKLLNVYAKSLCETVDQYEDAKKEIANITDLQILVSADIEKIKSTLTNLSYKKWSDIYQNIEAGDSDVSTVTAKKISFVNQLQSFVEELLFKISKLKQYEKQFYEKFNKLEFCDYTHENIKSIIGEIQSLVQEAISHNFSRTSLLVDFINTKIENILLEKLKLQMSLFKRQWETDGLDFLNVSQVHDLTIQNMSTLVSPPLSNSKDLFIAKLDSLNSVVKNQNQIVSSPLSSDTDLEKFSIQREDIILTYKGIISIIQKKYEQAMYYIEKWDSLQFIWDTKLNGMILDKFVAWFNLFSKMDEAILIFDTIETYKIFGLIKINTEQAQLRIYSQFNIYQNHIGDLFSQFLFDVSNSINNTVETHLNNIKASNVDLKDTPQTVEKLNILSHIQHYLSDNKASFEHIKNGYLALQNMRFVFPPDCLSIETFNNNLSELESLFASDISFVNSHSETISTILSDSISSLRRSIVQLRSKWSKHKPTEKTELSSVVSVLQNFEKLVDDITQKYKYLRNACDIVNIPFNVDFTKERDEIMEYNMMWTTVLKLYNHINHIRMLEWETFNVDETMKSLGDVHSESEGTDYISFAPFQTVKRVLSYILKSLPFLNILRKAQFDESHWAQIFEHTKKKLPEVLFVGDVLDLDVLQNEKYLKHVVSNAESEKLLEQSIKEVEKSWLHQKFEVYVSVSKVTLLSGGEYLLEKIVDDISTLESIKSSPFFSKFTRRVANMEEKLNSIFNILSVWYEAQTQWVYLLGVFKEQDELTRLMPLDVSRFKNVSHELKYIITSALKTSVVMDILNVPEIELTIKKTCDILITIKKSLLGYLEKQREIFPRFFFIGDDDLLEFIGNSTDILVINKHIQKIFPGIASVFYDEAGTFIKGIKSIEGEELLLYEPIVLPRILGLVDLLQSLQNNVQNTLFTFLKSILQNIHSKASFSKDSFWNIITSYPNQILLLGYQIHFTGMFEQVFEHQSYDGLSKELEDYIGACIDYIKTNLDYLSRRKIENLLLELIHKRDILSFLVENEAIHAHSSKWFSEQKFYYNESSTDKLCSVIVKHCNNVSFYGFEYLGNPRKLAYTPLLSSAFSLLSEALDQNLGGLLLGPAGTGKTETVKSLGYNLGRLTFVFCCDDSFDVESVSRIMIGISQVGAWGCFDEFNRLNEQTLSGISTQIEKIQLGLADITKTIELINKPMSVHQNSGIFITSNPSYEGRSILPDNIRSKFLTYSMMIPDFKIISRDLLITQGFGKGSLASEKLVGFFNFLNQNCSQQKHYDFSLRSVKSVIIHSGKLLRKIKNTVDELALVKKGCCDVVLPRLMSHDEDTFYSALSSFFGSVEAVTYDIELTDILRKTASSKGYTASKFWIDKCLQVYEIQKINPGFMLVGESCSGKSVAFCMLLDAISQYENRENVCYRMNCKTLERTVIFGKLDYTTREWKDGVFTQIMRKIGTNHKQCESKNIWIVFDGDVDPLWVENLNSLLDDNKVLSLPNGETIHLPENVRIVFEVEGLDHATPATISRCGIILFNREYFNMNDLSKSLSVQFKNSKVPKEDEINKSLMLSGLSVADYKSDVVNLISDTLDKQLLDHIWTMVSNYRSVLKLTKFEVVSNIYRYMSYFFNDFIDFISNSSDFKTEYGSLVKKQLFYSILWSMGCGLQEADQLSLARNLFNLPKFYSLFEENECDSLINSQLVLPEGELKSLESSLPVVDLHAHQILGSGTMIPTVDTMKYENMIFALLNQHKPLLLCGPPGSGKTMMLLSCIRESFDFDLLGLNLSKETTINTILKSLEQCCHYKKSNNNVTLTPNALGKWLVLFCDEVNLPKIDKFGTQIVIQFLKQLFVDRGFWHPVDKVWVTIEKIQFVGACNPSSTAGRIIMTDRFVNHCTTIMVDYPSALSLKRIYSVYTKSILRTVPDLIGFSDALADAMISVYLKYKELFSESDKPHYICSPRELTRWVKGLYIALRPHTSLSLESLIRVWVHEGLRLFSDRLILPAEKQRVFDILKDAAIVNFPHIDLAEAFKLPILFSDWTSFEYQNVSEDELKIFVANRFQIFNEEESNVNIIMYDDLLDHILRVDRVLKNEQGHMILVGPSGSGKTTLVKFVSWMNGIESVQLNVKSGFSLIDFENILKDLLLKCITGKKICFLIDESTILEDSFLEKMNTLLANAEVPGLFEGEEYDDLISVCLKASQDEGLLLDSNDEVYQWFVQQTAKNFHVIFTMSDLYGTKDKPFITSSALFNRCVVNWMGTWSNETLTQVTESTTKLIPLDKSKFQPNIDSEIETSTRNIIVNLLLQVYRSVNELLQIDIAPCQFLKFLKTFATMFVDSQNSSQELNTHINRGLNHLKETFMRVKKLGTLLNEKEVQLKIEDEKARKLLDKMISDQNESERKQDMSLKMQELFVKQEKAIISRRELVMNELNDVEIVIEEAQKGVMNIKKPHLTELRSMHNPPDTIKLVLEAICIMLGFKVSTWRDVQQVIRKDDFIASIIGFKGDEQITEELIHYMESTYLSKENFNYESANRASKACGPLLMWVKAQLRFSSIVVKINPLKKELNDLESELVDTKAKVIAIESLISDLQSEIEKYKLEYSENIRVKENIRIEMEFVKEKLERSVALLKGLKSEHDRWEKNICEFKKEEEYVTGNVIIQAAFLSFLGICTPNERLIMFEKWKELLRLNGVAFDSKIDINYMPDILSADNIIKWKTMGLSDDMQFIGNTSIFTSSYNEQFSFIIDPSNHLVPFLTKLLQPKKLTITSFLDPEFIKKLKNCIKFGGHIIIQDGEYYDPILNRLISKDIEIIGANRMMVKLGNEEIDLSPEFQLYITTKDSSAHIPTFVMSRMNILNYTFTKSSMINEALNLILHYKEPEMEQKGLKLIKLNSEYKLKLRNLEKELLHILSNSEDSILDNNELLSKLEFIKKETITLEGQMIEIDEMMLVHKNIREQYTSLGELYANISQLFDKFSTINKIYSFSNNYVKMIFIQLLETNIDFDITDLKVKFVHLVYSNSCVSLLSEEKKVLLKLLSKLVDNEIDIKKMEESDFNEHILNNSFLLLRSDKGNDCSVTITDIAEDLGKTVTKYALGSNDGFKVANKLIAEHKNRDGWIIIENIQYSNEFLQSISDVIEIMKLQKDVKFKLFLTCSIDSSIPPLLIQSCKSIIIEKPSSLKRCFVEIALNESNTLSLSQLKNKQPKEIRKLSFILVWFYSLITTRMKYSIKGFGFNNQYSINQNDLKNAEKFLFKFIESNYNDKFELNDAMMNTIANFISGLIFGGKVDDDSDLKLLIELGFKIFRKELVYDDDSINLLILQKEENNYKLTIPKGYDIIDCVDWINELPENEPMEWLGLPSDFLIQEEQTEDRKIEEVFAKLIANV